MKHKTLKPIEVDAQFKYRCENNECQAEQWLFLNQVKTKGFKLVCECGAVYTIKQVDKMKVSYVKRKSKSNIEHEPNNSKDYLNKACKILQHYGFSDKESKELVYKVYDITKCEDPVLLVKDSLRIFGGI